MTRAPISHRDPAWISRCGSYDAAGATFAEIARMPGIGERWPSANPRLQGLRVWRIAGFPKHLVFYRPSEDGIDIVRFIHEARNLDAALEP